MPKKIKLYQMIFDHFLGLLQSGTLQPGDRIATEDELLQQFPVSRITIVRALKELEHLGLIVRMKRKGSFVAAYPLWKTGEAFITTASQSSRAQQMVGFEQHLGTYSNDLSNEESTERMPIVAVVLPYDEQIGLALLKGVEQECAKEGLYVTFHNSQEDVQRERDILDKLHRDRVSGIILYPWSGTSNLRQFSELFLSRFPFVLIDRGIEGLDAPIVLSDHYQGGYEVTRHLIGLGHRRIAFFSPGEQHVLSVSLRYRGYCRAMMEAGIPLRAEWIVQHYPEMISLSDSSTTGSVAAAKYLQQLLAMDEAPTALVTINDFTALFMLKAAEQLGIRIPQQLSITGYDNLPFSEHMQIPLTTVEQPFEQIGRAAARIIIGYKHRQVPEAATLLPVNLVVRQSTAKPFEHN